MTSLIAVSKHRGRAVVAVPVKDEAALLEPCLTALTTQRSVLPDEILVFVNNSTDASAVIAKDFATRSPVRVLVNEVILPPEESHAGGARRSAMQWAAARAGEDGILLTTDADGVVGPDWMAVNFAAIGGGAEAVAGRSLLDPNDEARLPPAMIEADASECQYAALLDEIASLLDPDPLDPLPRHDEHSGASIAVTMAAYLRAGGMPCVESGEDRAFFAELRRVDARIRHAVDAVVTVSGRIEGRAAGGMAETIRRRMIATDAFLDSRLEPAWAAITRVGFRSRLRGLWRAGPDASSRDVNRLAAGLRVAPSLIRRGLASGYFGALWSMLEAQSPRLRRRLVPVAAVHEQIAVAQGFMAARKPVVAMQELLA